MNKEIKFRLWDSQLERMYIQGKNVNPELLSLELFKNEAICRNGNVQYHYPLNQEHVHLMQFTGLLDCDGKDVYEGDILEYEDYYGTKNLWTIKCELETNCGCCNTIYGWEISENLDKSKIIGNIYENTDLIGM